MSEERNKCYANFVCSDCATMIKDTFYYNTIKEALTHSITCPVCGKKGVQTSAPDSMKDVVLGLLVKGYHVAVINESTLCIVIKGRFESPNIEKDLPYEFTLDRTESMGDIIINERLKADDFENMNKDDYIVSAIDSLMRWIGTLDDVSKYQNRQIYYVEDETVSKDEVASEEVSNIAKGYAPYSPASPYPIKNGYACKYTWEEINDMYNNLSNEEKEKFNTLEDYVDTLFDMEDYND